MQYVLLTLLFSLTFSTFAPKQLVKFTISSYILPDKKLQMQLDVVTPRTPSSYATILFMTGLSGLAPSFFQEEVIDSVAQSGYVFLTVSKLQGVNPEKVTTVLTSVMAWLDENLQLVLNNRVPGVVADLDNRLILIGHSAANHVTTEYLVSTCGKVKLQILLDPVDGVDPYGIKKDYVVTPGKFLTYATPVLVIAAELDPVRKELEPNACAPAQLSNTRFYNAMSGPKWFLNFTKYGHVDFWNNDYRDLGSSICATCRKDCNFADYRTTIKQAILSFIDAVLYSDQAALSVIEEAKFRVPASHAHNYMGYNIKRGGFCERVKQQPNLNAQ